MVLNVEIVLEKRNNYYYTTGFDYLGIRKIGEYYLLKEHLEKHYPFHNVKRHFKANVFLIGDFSNEEKDEIKNTLDNLFCEVGGIER